VDALIDVDASTAAELPDDILVAAASRVLAEQHDPDFVGASVILRDVLFNA
jgi:hypothetical protein